jgi:hypothetical protein
MNLKEQPGSSGDPNANENHVPQPSEELFKF